MDPNVEINVLEGASSNYNWAILGDLLIAFARSGTVAPERFDQYLDAIRKREPKSILSISEGTAHVTSVQRKAAAELVKDKNIRIAVVLDSAVTRGFITALSWLGVGIKSFGPGAEKEALDYLEVSEDKLGEALELLEWLREHTQAEQ